MGSVGRVDLLLQVELHFGVVLERTGLGEVDEHYVVLGLVRLEVELVGAHRGKGDRVGHVGGEFMHPVLTVPPEVFVVPHPIA